MSSRPRGSELDLIDPLAPPRKQHFSDATPPLTRIALTQWDIKMLVGGDEKGAAGYSFSAEFLS